MATSLDGTNGLTFNDGTQMGTANSLGMRNALFNADFRINQRGYASAATLAAGAYGHDRFKAGASGGDYSFTQLNSSTQVTIASGKSLIQVVEDKNVVGGSYVLSWTGTALARVGVDSATPSGTFVVSPILITGQTAGTTMSVEFNAGTLNTAQLELGTVATPFERRPIGFELALCQRYFYQRNIVNTATDSVAVFQCFNAGSVYGKLFDLPVTMRATPTGSLSSISHFRPSSSAGSNQSTFSAGAIDYLSPTAIGTQGFSGSSGLTAGNATLITANTTSAWIAASAEL